MAKQLLSTRKFRQLLYLCLVTVVSIPNSSVSLEVNEMRRQGRQEEVRILSAIQPSNQIANQSKNEVTGSKVGTTVDGQVSNDFWREWFTQVEKGLKDKVEVKVKGEPHEITTKSSVGLLSNMTIHNVTVAITDSIANNSKNESNYVYKNRAIGGGPGEVKGELNSLSSDSTREPVKPELQQKADETRNTVEEGRDVKGQPVNSKLITTSSYYRKVRAENEIFRKSTKTGNKRNVNSFPDRHFSNQYSTIANELEFPSSASWLLLSPRHEYYQNVDDICRMFPTRVACRYYRKRYRLPASKYSTISSVTNVLPNTQPTPKHDALTTAESSAFEAKDTPTLTILAATTNGDLFAQSKYDSSNQQVVNASASSTTSQQVPCIILVIIGFHLVF